MTIEKEAEIYFVDNAKAWQNNAYLANCYNYSVPLNRLRVLKKILKGKPEIKTILDIGCGGAYLSIELSKLGYQVTALDQSPKMLDIARKNISKESQEIQKRIVLKKGSVDKCDVEECDCAIAMGLIGYLDSDDKLFQSMKTKIKKNGRLIVSFRNHLFNLFSISFRTLHDIEHGKFKQLIEEADSYYQAISIEKTQEFLKTLALVAMELSNVSLNYADNEQQNHIPYSQSIEPRQTTPKEAEETAAKYGYQLERTIAVHPHFAVPKLNKNLPPAVYNRISDSFIPFEEEKIALLWSSVFIDSFINNYQ